MDNGFVPPTNAEHQAPSAPYPRDCDRLIVFVAATPESHGFGCRSCCSPLPAGFAAVHVETNATPGASGHLHFVCDSHCAKGLLDEFRAVGGRAELWNRSRLRAWLDHDELVAGVVGVRSTETEFGAGFELCEPVLPRRNPQ